MAKHQILTDSENLAVYGLWHCMLFKPDYFFKIRVIQYRVWGFKHLLLTESWDLAQDYEIWIITSYVS